MVESPMPKIWRRVLRIANAISQIPFFTPHEEEALLNVLAHSHDGATPELKLKLYELLYRLRQRRRKPFGMIVVLGWQREWNRRYASLPDKTQNLFRSRPFDLRDPPLERLLEKFSQLADFDGAVLVNRDGEIVASGMYLESMTPKKVAEILNPDHSEDLSAAFGFMKKVHTRHLAAISASFWLSGATVFVVSEEDGSIRIFENGKIIWSTIKKEIWPT
jgi:DNA integrity scanning protein DisA with diadenylate cyclase activity